MKGQERERKEPSEFNVVVKAKDLVKHTFTITNSTERYPKKYRFTLVNRIQDKAVDIYELTLEANELDLRIASEYEERQRLQAKALTYCKELLERSAIRKGKRTKFYYCHPYSSFERGSNENQNRMIRRRYPKGTDFAKVSTADLKSLESWINNYPREILGWRTSEMVYQECLAALT